MTDYSAQELSRMQQEAKARVVEMQNRSRLYAAQMNRAFTEDAKKTGTDPTGASSATGDSSAERVSRDPSQKNGAERETAERKPELPKTGKIDETGSKRQEEERTDQKERLLLLTLFAVLQGERNDDLLPLLLLTLI